MKGAYFLLLVYVLLWFVVLVEMF